MKNKNNIQRMNKKKNTTTNTEEKNEQRKIC